MSCLLEKPYAKTMGLGFSSNHFTSVLRLSKIVHPPKPVILSISVQNTVLIAHSFKWKYHESGS
eukprot:scaffold13947_cov113-Amphora_coffeaeformis.AAC.1